MKPTHHYILNMLKVTPEMGLGSITTRLREHHAITLPQPHVKFILDQMVSRGEIGTIDRRKGTNETYPGYFVAPERAIDKALAKAVKRRDKAVQELQRADLQLKRLVAQRDSIDAAETKVDRQVAWVRDVDTVSVLGAAA